MRPTPKPGGDAATRLRPIEGRHNALVKELRQAFSRGERTADGFTAIEGLRTIDEAIRGGLRFRAVFFSHSAQARAPHLLPQLGNRVETVVLPDKLFSTAVPTETPQGIAALVRWNEFTLDHLLRRSQDRPLVALAGLQDPGNLGTILRSADAFDAAGLLLGEGTVNPFNPKVVRASAGSIFRLPFVQVKLASMIAELKHAGLRLVATSSHKGTVLPEADLAPPVAIFIGNEGAGLPSELLHQMNDTVMIPHAAHVESLNAGIAASIVLYECARQRRA